MRSIRSQADDLGDEVSAANGVDCSDAFDHARQEFLEETDVHYVLSRYGVGAFQARQPSYGDTDFDLDLHSAYVARRSADHAFRVLPFELQQRFRDVEGMLDAMNTGELDHALRELATRPETPPEPVTGDFGVSSGRDPSPEAPPPPAKA